MKFLKKLKSGNFWVSLISCGVLVAEVVFDFEIKTEYLNQILLGLLGLLTMCGIVTDHGECKTIVATSNEQSEQKHENSESISNIKSICDTISLMLNKVSINSSLHEVEPDVKENDNSENQELDNPDGDNNEDCQQEISKGVCEQQTEIRDIVNMDIDNQ